MEGTSTRMMNKVGPSGNKGGKQWDQKGRHGIVQFIVSYEPQKINSLQFQYVEEDGNWIMSEVFGNPEFVGSGFSAWKLDYPFEYITLVRGWYNSSGIEELTVSTNKLTYTFGKASDSDDKKWFWYDFGGLNQFGGFHGTCDSQCVKSIGVYFKPVMALAPCVPNSGKEDPAACEKSFSTDMIEESVAQMKF